MLPRRLLSQLAALTILPAAAAALPYSAHAQDPPPPSAARILLLPRQVVSGERATLAVLDVNGRLTPGVTVAFSNGDRLTTDTTGRALFVAPLSSGILFASIAGRAGRVPTAVLTPAEAAADSLEILAAPKVASVSDRFELAGRGFCGDADSNRVTIAGKPALVLASSPASLVVLPPEDAGPGVASVQVACAKRAAAPFSLLLVGLQLEADASPIKPADHRTLTVHIRGTAGNVVLEARNLAPDVAELSGGPLTRHASTGGADNQAKFEVIGKKQGSFLISIRLVSGNEPPRH
ncbi:MAG TPA: hypothetical protein VOA78_05830 [Candidatus Dormibacteraeota bacterium]|nr:hypothetical protein [Candidatus Dormibacteraeota bacterium]